MATGLNDGKIKVYDSSKSLVKTVSAHTNRITYLKALTNGRMASGAEDSYIKIWNTATWSLITTYKEHAEPISSIYQIDDDTLASCSGSSANGYFNIWSISTATGSRRVYLTYWCRSLQLLSNGLMATGNGYGQLQFWDYTSSSYDVPVKTIQDSTTSNTIFDIALIDSQYLATASTDKTIKIWDYQSYTLVRTLSGHTNTVRSLKLFSSKYLISGSYDKSIRVWDLETYSQITKYTATNYVYSVDVYSSDIAVSGDLSQKLVYFNITSGSLIKSKSTSSAVYAIASF